MVLWFRFSVGLSPLQRGDDEYLESVRARAVRVRMYVRVHVRVRMCVRARAYVCARARAYVCARHPPSRSSAPLPLREHNSSLET